MSSPSHAPAAGFDLGTSTIAIVGLGLMGGSLALALKRHDPAPAIIGITRQKATFKTALAGHTIDVGSDRLEAARDADMVVLATPVRTIVRQLGELAEIARDGATLLDLGSTKRAIVAAMNALPERLQAIGGHPLCGKEVTGLGAAEAALYQDKMFVLTPSARTTPGARAAALALVHAIGARPIEVLAERHDRVVAAISHLPFVVASTLTVAVAADVEDGELKSQLAASGYRDTSRLAASDTDMMLDILLTNSENVADFMRQFSRAFGELADAIYDEDEPFLRERLARAALVRRQWKAPDAE